MSEKRIIQAPGSASSDLPLSQATVFGSLVFVSGTVSIDLDTGAPLFGSIEDETEQVIRNVKRILESAGSSLPCVLKTTVFLTDAIYFEPMNRVYRRHFGDSSPARSALIVTLAAAFKVEIEAIAYIPAKR